MYLEILRPGKAFKIKSLFLKNKKMLEFRCDISVHDTSSLVTTSRIHWNSQVYHMKGLENESQFCLKHYQRQKYSKKL